MRSVFLLSVFLLSVLADNSRANDVSAQEQTSYDGAHVRRWTVVVSDLEETIRLYRDILGFELGDVRPDKKTSHVYEVFNIDPAIDTTHVTFHSGADKRVLSAVVVPNIRFTKAKDSPFTAAILFNVAGRFDAVIEGLRQAGYQVQKPHVLGSNGMEVGFSDKDGHLHVIYEIPYTGEKFQSLISGGNAG